MGFYVYLIHNIVNNKVYVGKTINPKQRWFGHLSFARNRTGSQYIHKAIRKYGSGNFTFSVIQELFSESEYNEAERYWVKYFNSNNHLHGYNLTDGGDGSLGRKQSAFTRKKISDAKLNTMMGELNPFYGQKHTTETRKLISTKNAGLRRTDDFKKERSRITSGENNPFYGKNTLLNLSQK
jgi:group I intron endonuclease